MHKHSFGHLACIGIKIEGVRLEFNHNQQAVLVEELEHLFYPSRLYKVNLKSRQAQIGQTKP